MSRCIAAIRRSGTLSTHIDRFCACPGLLQTGGRVVRCPTPNRSPGMPSLDIKGETHCTIIGPRAEQARVPGLDQAVAEGDSLRFGGFDVRVLETPGHTAGHITYWLPEAGVAFVGDTLFALGCGRVIEGNQRMMWRSLQKLMRLPPHTSLYCGHEYTQANAKFALTIEPENDALQKRAKEVNDLRAAGKATLPTRVDLELATNPFLRPDSPAIQKRLGMVGRPEWEIF